jgi:hypothetical protein
MNTSFLSWIQSQSERNDSVGRFARDVVADAEAPKGSSKGDWLYHLAIRKAGPGATAACHQAWAEYDALSGDKPNGIPKIMLNIGKAVMPRK